MSTYERARVCRTCGEIKPLDREHYHRDPKGRGGWKTQCKSCAVSYARKRAAAKRADVDVPSAVSDALAAIDLLLESLQHLAQAVSRVPA
jgi:hypothetical protein